MREELLKEGYVFYLHKDNDKIYGNYIKGNDLEVEGVYEEKDENLIFLQTLPHICQNLNSFDCLAIFYDYEMGQYVGEIRREKFHGSYNEGRCYDVKKRVEAPLSVMILLSMDQILGDVVGLREQRVQELDDLVEGLDAIQLEILIRYIKQMFLGEDKEKDLNNKPLIKSRTLSSDV